MSTRRIPKVPDTPSALAKYATKSTTGESERARIGCTLLLASKLAELSGTASQILDVTLKSQPAPGPSPELVRSLEHEVSELRRGTEADANRLTELHDEVRELKRERQELQTKVCDVRRIVDIKRPSAVAKQVLAIVGPSFGAEDGATS